MKNAFVNSSLNYLIRNHACNEKQKNIFLYTLESIYSLVTKTTVVLLLSFFLKTFPITLTCIILYSILRGFAFGIHATKNIYCWCITLFVYIIGPLFIKFISIDMIYIYMIYVLGTLAILLWAPADTPSRPLLDKKKRQTNKIISFIFIILLILSSFYINIPQFYSIIAFILLLESICICPLTYKLFSIPYHNYLHYHK